MMKKLASFALPTLAVLAACSARPGDGVGSLELHATAIEDIANVTATLQPDVGQPISLVLTKDASGQQWSGRAMRIPIGTYSVHASATDSPGTVLFEASSVVSVSPGTNPELWLVLQQVGVQPTTNTAPTVSSWWLSTNTPAPGEVITVSATATGQGTVTYTWSATAGTFLDAKAAETRYTAPATEGQVEITLTVSDSLGATSTVKVSFYVANANARGHLPIVATVNLAPSNIAVHATGLPLDVGGTTPLSATFVDDDAQQSYSWTASPAVCASFDDPASATPTLTANALGTCKIILYMTDPRGGANYGQLTFTIGPPAVANIAPQVTSMTMSPSTITSATIPIVFQATAIDPENQTITTTWSAARGRPSTATGDSFTWNPPTCNAVGSIYDILTTVTDSDGAANTVATTIESTTQECYLAMTTLTPKLTSGVAGATAVTAQNAALLVGGFDAANAPTTSVILANSLDAPANATFVQQSDLVTAVGAAAAVALPTSSQYSWVYAIGGSGAAGAVSTIQRAQLDSKNLTLGQWSSYGDIKDDMGITHTLTGHVPHNSDGSLYLIAGQKDGVYSGEVVATTVTNGEPGPTFAPTNGALAVPRADFALVRLADRLCALGGMTASGPTDSVECAPLDAMGDISGAWTDSGKLARPSAGGVAYMDGHAKAVVYLGGTDGVRGYADNQSAFPSPVTGRLDFVLEANGGLAGDLYGAASASVGGYLYTFGGYQGGMVTRAVEVGSTD